VARQWTDATREEYLTAMGPDLSAIYVPLGESVTELHFRWSIFKDLFTDADAFAILQQSAPVFFRTMLQVLADDMMLQLSKLTDSPETGRNRNLTIQRLSPLLSDASLKAEVNVLVEKAVAATDHARVHRRKTIAHLDLDVAISSQDATQLPKVTVSDLDAALTAVTDVLQRLELHYRESDLDFKPVTFPKATAQLLNALDRGVRAEETRLQRLRAHRPDPDDLRPPRW
jgi:hypothetical protein